MSPDLPSRLSKGTVLTTQEGRYGWVQYEVQSEELDDAKGRIAARIKSVPIPCAGEPGDWVFIDPRDIGPGKLEVISVGS